MLRTTLLCLMLALSEEVEQHVVESISYQIGHHISHCHSQLRMGASDLDRYVGFWSEEFDFDVWFDGCLVQCVLQRLGIIDREGNLDQTSAFEFAEENGADVEQTQELYAMLTTQCVISELMPDLPEVNQPHECVKPMLMAICFRRGIIEAMEPEDRRRTFGYHSVLSPWEKLYAKLSPFFTF